MVGSEDSAQSFSDRIFWKSFRVVDVRAFRSPMSAPKCLFSRILSTLTEVLGRHIRANEPWMSVGYPGQKLTLWADFSFLTWGLLGFFFFSFSSLGIPAGNPPRGPLRGPGILSGSGLVVPLHRCTSVSLRWSHASTRGTEQSPYMNQLWLHRLCKAI